MGMIGSQNSFYQKFATPDLPARRVFCFNESKRAIMPLRAAAFAASMVLPMIERSEYLDKWRQEQRMSFSRWEKRSPAKALWQAATRTKQTSRRPNF
jgi:hypothetical protein